MESELNLNIYSHFTVFYVRAVWCRMWKVNKNVLIYSDDEYFLLTVETLNPALIRAS